MAKIQVTQCDLCERASMMLRGQEWLTKDGETLAVCKRCTEILVHAEARGLIELNRDRRPCEDWETVLL